MKQRIKLGVVCLARKTFDYEAALDTYRRAQKELGNIEEVEWEFIDGLTIEIEDAVAAARELSAADLDGLVIISGTFHLGHLALILAREVAKPVLLWAFSELPYDGGKIRLNSACGVNLNASNLYKAGFFDFDYHVGDSIDQDWVDAIRIKAALRGARVGIVGGHAHGFYNTEPQALDTFRELGTLLIQFQHNDLMGQLVEDDEAKEALAKVREVFDCSGVTDEQVEKTARLSVAFRKFIEANSLTAVAVRCWPEFADMWGTSPCSAMSLVQGDGLITACEGDTGLALSMIAMKAIGDPAPFSADLSQVNFDEDFALMWHCGVAPCTLWDGKSVRGLDTYFAGGRGVTADFVLKEGDFSILRLDQAHGENRMLTGRGQALPMEKELKGTYAKVRFDRPISEVYETVVMNGFAHHVAMGYGDYLPVLRKFARLSGMEVFGA